MTTTCDGDEAQVIPSGLAVQVVTAAGVETWPVELVELAADAAGVTLSGLLVRASDGRQLSLAVPTDAPAGTVDDVVVLGFAAAVAA